MFVEETPAPRREFVRRADAAARSEMGLPGVGQGDLAPLRLTVLSLFRFGWIAVILAGAVGGLGWTLAADDEATPSARSRVGLTQAAVWPFYDVEIEAAQFTVNSDAFQQQVESSIGTELDDLRTSTSAQLAVFDIVATAADGDTAVEAAELAARLVVEWSDRRLMETFASELETLQTQMEELEARRQENEDELAEVAEALSIVRTEREISDSVELSDQDFDLARRRDSLARTLTSLEVDLASKVTMIGEYPSNTPQPMLQVVRAAELDPEQSSTSRVAVYAAAGLVFLAASAAAVILDRQHGAIRSAWQVRNVCGSGHVVEMSPGEGSAISGIAALADRIDTFAGPGSLVGFVDATSLDLRIDDVAAALELHGVGAEPDVSSSPIPLDGIVVVDVSTEFRDVEAPRPVSRRCEAIVIMVDRETGIRRATSLIQRVQLMNKLATTVLARNR